MLHTKNIHLWNRLRFWYIVRKARTTPWGNLSTRSHNFIYIYIYILYIYIKNKTVSWVYHLSRTLVVIGTLVMPWFTGITGNFIYALFWEDPFLPLFFLWNYKEREEGLAVFLIAKSTFYSKFLVSQITQKQYCQNHVPACSFFF